MIAVLLLKEVEVKGEIQWYEYMTTLPDLPNSKTCIYIGPDPHGAYDEDNMREHWSIAMQCRNRIVTIYMQKFIWTEKDDRDSHPHDPPMFLVDWAKHFVSFGWKPCEEPKGCDPRGRIGTR